MTRILLTGAGFSRNWGGWLASEAFEYLLGCSEIDQETRNLLWRSKDSGGGFEDTLADLAAMNDDEGRRRLTDLTAALVGMFNAMSQGFKQRQFEFQPKAGYTVKAFLEQFHAIFTLNQDTLLELCYLDDAGSRMPGIKPLSSIPGTPQADVTVWEPDPNNFKLAPRSYVKLHGSCNWNAGPSGGRILIMGGQKAISIDQFPILTWYHKLFREFLLRPDARLMVIGYSFGDDHINKAIGDGVDKGHLKLFIIDPLGVDVLDDKRKKVIGPRRQEPMELLARSVIGASRRPLTSIFNDDVVEHARVMKFFA
jgi:hypothetical protein